MGCWWGFGWKDIGAVISWGGNFTLPRRLQAVAARGVGGRHAEQEGGGATIHGATYVAQVRTFARNMGFLPLQEMSALSRAGSEDLRSDAGGFPIFAFE